MRDHLDRNSRAQGLQLRDRILVMDDNPQTPIDETMVEWKEKLLVLAEDRTSPIDRHSRPNPAIGVEHLAPIRLRISLSKRSPSDQVVQTMLVQDQQARRPQGSIIDVVVCGIVPLVVKAKVKGGVPVDLVEVDGQLNVDLPTQPVPSLPCLIDEGRHLRATCQKRQQLGTVIGNARFARRKGRKVGKSHGGIEEIGIGYVADCRFQRTR